MENAVAALAVAVDGVGAPHFTRRRGDTFTVQRLGDSARTAAGRILFEDAADDASLCLIDVAQAPLGFAVGAKRHHTPVAVAQPARNTALRDPADLTTPGFLTQILQEQCSHRAFETDVKFRDFAFRQRDYADARKAQPLVEAGNIFLVNFAFRQRDYADARKAQPLVEAGNIFLVTAQPVKRFCHKDVERVGPVHQGVEPWPIARSARDGKVGKDLDQIPAFLVDPGAT
ncbi:hypothetical protein ASF09_19365 [Sphingomonas sp. Leaf242]|nr:hypothetical protein [Sphingomonas sp. Leaf242]KQO11091.1 hypothetical protein ASF09_19365 [Sphingomonas sp. Leaf242]